MAARRGGNGVGRGSAGVAVRRACVGNIAVRVAGAVANGAHLKGIAAGSRRSDTGSKIIFRGRQSGDRTALCRTVLVELYGVRGDI
ncbi:hypothetical protein SDC9_99310 [bioreactor metagenome]|uniref:Uncharacterized protein n=1 Tax=bioreactor metagenome TaxID=1076179 RepID=A0A645AH73_9ZZZZ